MISKCARCENTRFELAEVSPEKSNFKFQFVQCTLCGNPVGVVDFFDTHTGIEGAKTAIKKLERKIDSLEYLLKQIVYALSRR